MDETGGQLSLGKTSFTIIATNFVQNWEYLRNLLGIFSCEMLAFRVKWYLAFKIAKYFIYCLKKNLSYIFFLLF